MSSLSRISQDEFKSWEQDHTIIFDRDHRSASLEHLKIIKDGSKAYLAYSNNSSISGLASYQHWFIVVKSNAEYFIEFGSGDMNYSNATVNINLIKREKTIVAEFQLTSAVRQRIEHVLGMTNYSLCLRNCEHVANYIYDGNWKSSQVAYFRGVLKLGMGEKEKFINEFPSKIRPHVFLENNEEKIYPFISDQLFKPIQLQYYLDDSRNTYNVLMIGPTGSGKSRLINVLFNRNIVESRAGFETVTQDVYFLRAEKPDNMVLENYNQLIFIDTIGLCDNYFGNGLINEYTRHRISQNLQHLDVVLIVIPNERLVNDVTVNIKTMLEWLKYEQYSQRFVFVITKSDYLRDNEKVKFKNELRKRLNVPCLKDDAVLFTDFSQFHEHEFKKSAIKDDINSLVQSIIQKRDCSKIPVNFDNAEKIKEACILL